MSALEEYDWSFASFTKHLIALLILPLILILWPLMYVRYSLKMSTLFSKSSNLQGQMAGEE